MTVKRAFHKLRRHHLGGKCGGRNIHIEVYKQFKWNLYFYVSGQNRPLWAVLKLNTENEDLDGDAQILGYTA